MSSGFYYNPFIPNIFLLQFFQWFLDYALRIPCLRRVPAHHRTTPGRARMLPFPFNDDPGRVALMMRLHAMPRSN